MLILSLNFFAPFPIAIHQVPSWPQLKIHALGEILLMCRETKDMEEIAHR